MGTVSGFSSSGGHGFSNNGAHGFSQLLDTTGYSPNPGVWARIQEDHDRQQQKRQSRHADVTNKPTQSRVGQKGPLNRKRKLWGNRPPGPQGPAMTQIWEGDEEAALSQEQTRLSMDGRKLSLEVQGSDREGSQSPSDDGSGSGVEVDGTTQGRENGVGPREPSVPNIIITSDPEPARLAPGSGRPHSNNQNSLKPPKFKPNSASMFPRIPDSFTYHPPPATNELSSSSETAIAIQRYMESPKYTHINVPRRPLRLHHVSQESIDSPLNLPRLFSPKNVQPQRKPMKISFSQSQKARMRKKWNFHSLDEPLNFFSTLPLSASSSATYTTSGSKSSTYPSQSTSSENTTGLSANGLSASDSNVTSNTFGQTCNKTEGSDFTLPRLKIRPSVLGIKSGVGAKGMGGDGRSPRKKWVMPNHWPQQKSSPGELLYCNCNLMGVKRHKFVINTEYSKIRL